MIFFWFFALIRCFLASYGRFGFIASTFGDLGITHMSHFVPLLFAFKTLFNANYALNNEQHKFVAFIFNFKIFFQNFCYQTVADNIFGTFAALPLFFSAKIVDK